MRTTKPTTRFKKDYKREQKGPYRKVLQEEFDSVIALLSNDAVLPARLSDHPMIGEWRGYRNCHIRPDFVLLYRKQDAEFLELARLGSHSELGI